MTPIPITDLRSFLAGAWRLERVVDDARRHEVGEMVGSADFAPIGPLLHYVESGELRLGRYSGAASQNYFYRFPAPHRAEVLFADRQLFHGLDLSAGSADVSHRCADDLYRARFTVVSPDEWRVTWQIDGPRKQQRIATRLRRP